MLVVIAIIGATAGVLGVALRGDNPAAALQSAQGTVASLLSAARSEAALKNSSAAVVVYAVNDGSDRYLRALAVADFDGTHWARSGDYIQLPTGVYVVPPESASPAPSNALTPFPVDGVNHYGLAFTAVGTPAGNGRIVLAAARRTADGPVFDNAANVRGLVVSAYGAVTFVNDASGFAQ